MVKGLSENGSRFALSLWSSTPVWLGCSAQSTRVAGWIPVVNNWCTYVGARAECCATVHAVVWPRLWRKALASCRERPPSKHAVWVNA